MKKVILIEDRPGRQSQFLSKNEIEQLQAVNGLSTSKTDETNKLISEIDHSAFDLLSDYQLIIIHRSALSDMGINSLNSYCKSTKKDLIYFSGGITQCNYYNDGYNLLNISVSELYNKSLSTTIRDYIEGKVQHLLEIVYGRSWRLSTMLCYRQWLTSNVGDIDLEKKEAFNAILGKTDYTLEVLNKEINKKFILL